VQTHGWLTPPQMIDGLALGETTPGPLIMVVAFVGYVGTQAGPDAGFAAGAAGACVATFFTFLPSFLFILAGGPLVERTHGQARFVAPLTGITAAVVGVIVNLAVFFALNVFWPNGWPVRPDLVAMAIGLAAAVALFRFRAGVIPVILGAAALGAAVQGLSPVAALSVAARGDLPVEVAHAPLEVREVARLREVRFDSSLALRPQPPVEAREPASGARLGFDGSAQGLADEKRQMGERAVLVR
jgi:chromate transport protein ChrA